MPPATPRTTRRRSSLTGTPFWSQVASGTLTSSLGAFGVFEQALVDLAHRDGERLLPGAGLDQRADVLEQPFTELRVVVVDLPRALRRVDHQGVLGAGLVQQIIDRRVGDAFGRGQPRGI